MSPLKRIEENFASAQADMAVDPNDPELSNTVFIMEDVVKLARVLDWVSHINTVPRLTREACERTLEEVAGD